MSQNTNQNYDNDIWKRQSFPKKIHDKEDIILLIRQDIITLIFQALSYFLIFFILFLAKIVIVGFTSSLFWIYAYDTFLYSFCSLLILRFMFLFHDYYLSLQIITSDRIIDIDQQGLFRREVNVLSLENVQDINYKKTTLLSTIFNYGNVIIQTSGEEASEGGLGDHKSSGFVFNDVPNPSEIVSLIGQVYSHLKEKDNQDKADLNALAIKKALSEDPKSSL